MSVPAAAIPYERQADPQTNRLCGAASLSMVYRSFGKAVAQAEIWPRISKENRQGNLAGTTHLMARDALSRGFAAVAIQARHSLQVLRVCHERGIRAVLNHRLRADMPTGHYTVLVDIDGQSAVVHDPHLGPSRRIPHAELLDLWQPGDPHAEISGNVLIAIAAELAAIPACPACETAIPPAVECPRCRETVPLQPAAVLGCAGDCGARMWSYLCCPFCDYTWTFSVLPAPPAAALSEGDPAKLNLLFAELDKFCQKILSVPGATRNANLMRQLELLKGSKDMLKMAQSEAVANRKHHAALLTRLEQKFKQDEEALLKIREDIQKPARPPDGNILGQQLLKDLGLQP